MHTLHAQMLGLRAVHFWTPLKAAQSPWHSGQNQTSLTEEGVDSIVSSSNGFVGFVAWRLHVGLDIVLEAPDFLLPACMADVVVEGVDCIISSPTCSAAWRLHVRLDNLLEATELASTSLEPHSPQNGLPQEAKSASSTVASLKSCSSAPQSSFVHFQAALHVDTQQSTLAHTSSARHFCSSAPQVLFVHSQAAWCVGAL